MISARYLIVLLYYFTVLTFQTDHLRIESEDNISTDIDGEKGEPFPMEFSILHNRLRIFTEVDDI